MGENRRARKEEVAALRLGVELGMDDKGNIFSKNQWLRPAGSGGGNVGGYYHFDFSYWTTDWKRFVLVAKTALQAMKVPESTRIIIESNEGRTEYAKLNVYE